MTAPRRQLPDLRMLQTFESAARHGNFTRAGAELSLTQSAVSRQIRELEEQLGRLLFDRVRGRVVMTEAGRAFLREVEALLTLADTTMRQASAGADAATVLAVNAPPTFAARWLVPRLGAYLARHPQTRIDLATRLDIFDFATTRCDMAIHFGRPLWPGAVCTYLCSEIVVPVAGGALRDRVLRGPADLARAPKLHLSERPGLWPDWFAGCGMALDTPTAGHWFDKFSLTIAAARAGLGYALLPRYLIDDDLERGTLRIPLDMPLSTDKAYYIVTPEGRGEAVRSFGDWLIGAVRHRPMSGARPAG